jgi:RNA polymerase sigma factor (sigma-70 family)
LNHSIVSFVIPFPLKLYPDNEILECLKRRDNIIIPYMQKVYMPMIDLLAYRWGMRKEDAEDAFNEMIAILIDKLDKGELTLQHSLKRYIYGICKNLFIMQIEKRASFLKYCSKEVIYENESDFSEKHDRDIYEKIFLESLTKIESASQKLLKLCWQGIPPREIAKELGYKYSYLRKRKCIAKAELVSKVKEHRDFRIIEFSNLLIKKRIF